MKRTGILILLLILILQAGGLFVLLKIRQCQQQYIMQKTLQKKTSGYQTLILTKEQFRASKINGNEILFQGKLYDIKSSKQSNEQLELLVLQDNVEENLLAILKLITNTSHQHSKLLLQIVAFFSLTYVSPDSPTFLINSASITIAFLPYSNLQFMFIGELSSPPPKFG